jgi:two-component system chemotaxis sensor kinase CheA
MDFQGIVNSIKGIDEKISVYESGDLMAVLDIKDAYLELKEKVGTNRALGDLAKFIDLLSRICMKLSALELEEKARSLLSSSNKSLSDLFGKHKSGKEIADELNTVIAEIRSIIKSDKAQKKDKPVYAVDEDKTEVDNKEISVPEDFFINEGLDSAITTASDRVETYESGDLMKLVEIKEAYFKLKEKLLKLDSLKGLVERVNKLIEFTDSISDDEKVEGAKQVLNSANGVISEFFKGERKLETSLKKIDEIIEAAPNIIEEYQNRPKPALEVAKETDETMSEVSETEAATEVSTQESGDIAYTEESTEEGTMEYPPNYFANIVDDPKMIAQLSDEVKEHLDNAQYTLVELENDPTDKENINKVFRSFHTIKGSSAFLGLKNVEDVGHVMEDLLVLIRDNKIKITMDLIDVIFEGIDILRSLVEIMNDCGFDIEKMKIEFVSVDIFTYTKLLKKVLLQYQNRPIADILADAGWGKKFKGEEVADTVSQGTVKTKKSSSMQKANYVKVSNQRLNTLIDIVGELVINQSMLKQIIDSNESADTTAERSITQLESITTNIKNLVLSMGMVPIAEVFNKLKVVIRNTAAELNKSVDVEISGEDTELDRNVMESIYDPLVHIARNAVDHGIETPAERKTKGKNPVGRISISAEHRGNGIEIVVSDDGKGISKQKVIRKALEKKLIKEDDADNLSDKDIFGMMFLPGFSTAEKVTEVSGRGVGLDVVKKNIDEIHGKVEVFSEEGKYSKIVVKLPLTLAIIEGFVITVGENNYVLPFNAIDEIIVPTEDQIKVMDDGARMLFNRGHYIPLVSAAQIFKEKKCKGDITSCLIVIISYEGANYGIIVDNVVGKQEIVIKNLGESLQKLSLFSGGTIFGDGTIGFVIDIEGFLEEAKK